MDCVPTRKPSEIMADYQRLVKEPGFDLKAFVASNFTRPADPDDITLTSRSFGEFCVGILPPLRWEFLAALALLVRRSWRSFR